MRPSGERAGLADRIGHFRDLDPLGARKGAEPDRGTRRRPQCQHRQRDRRNRRDLPPVPATLCSLDRSPGVHDILQTSRRILVQTALHQLADARRSRVGQRLSNQARAPAPLRSCPANLAKKRPPPGEQLDTAGNRTPRCRSAHRQLCPRACSGLMYGGEPTMCPATVSSRSPRGR